VNDYRHGRPRERLAEESPAPLRLVLPGGAMRDGEAALKLPLRAAGADLDLALAVRDEPARLADLVAPARELADHMVSRLRRHAVETGAHVPCRKGCSACCRYLVPISPPEAFALADRMDRVQAPRRVALEEHFRRAARTILAHAPALAAPSTQDDLSRWCWAMKLDCPLLSAGACSLYSSRPLACREHFITGSARQCGEERSSQSAYPVETSLAHVLYRAAGIVEGTGPQSVFLPLAPGWAQDHSERRHRTYPAADLAKAFVQAIQFPQSLAA
jgi:Fe-S-cluster containining protein